jgi:hypothetical protein
MYGVAMGWQCGYHPTYESKIMSFCRTAKFIGDLSMVYQTIDKSSKSVAVRQIFFQTSL